MSQSNPIYSHDLYQPGAEDQLKLLHARLVQLQGDIKNMTISAKGLKTALGGLNVNNGGSQKQIIDLARKVEQLNRELERTKQAHQKTQQEIERTRLAEERRLAQSIKAEGALSREIDHANERRAASTRKQQASDQALDQKRIASAQRVADNQRRINAGIQSNAQKTAAAIANMNAIASARVGAINQSRGISQARANAQAAIQAQRLAVAQNQAATSSIRLSIAQNQNAASALRLAQAQRRAEEAAKRKTGTLSGLLGSIRSLTYAYFSLSAAQQIVGKLFSETKALNTLDIALKQTLGSIQAVTEAKQFLLDITERYGADLLTTSNAYLKFGTAAKQAGVSAQDTRNIFESVTKASSVLGLGAERTSYVFLALEQIMSKGRLSTEELRRQLGEHLPGAFGIAAKAMKVTTAELTDMLKKGEIASTDFLPKFAKELEKTYGIENLKRVDNLAAAQGRFNNEITLLIRELDVAGFFKDFFDSLAAGVKFVRENVDAFLKLGKALIYVGTAWAAFKIGEAITSMRLLTGATVALTNALKANPLGVVAAAAIALYGAIDILTEKVRESGEEVDVFAQRQREIANEVADANKTINAQAKALKDGNIPASQRKKIIEELNTSLAPYLDKLLTEKSSYDEIKKAVDLANVSLAKRVSLLQLEDEYKGKRDEESKINEQLASIAVEVARAEADLEDTKRKLQNTDVSGNKVPIGFDDKAVNAGNKLVDLTSKYNKLIAEQTTLQNRLVDIQEEYRRLNGGKPISIVDEILNSGGDGGDGGKDSFDAIKERIALIFDAQERELAELKRAYEEKKKLFIAHNEDTTKLDQKYRDDRVDILNKYIDIEQNYLDDIAERQKKADQAAIDAFTNKLQSSAKAQKFDRDRKEAERKNNVDSLREEFDARRKHEEAIFELEKHTDEEIQAFKLKQTADELNDEIQLHRIFGKVLSDEELARAIELRDKIRAQFTKDGKLIGGDKSASAETDIFSLLGIDFGGDNYKLDAFKSTIKIVGDELSSFVDLQKELVDQQIEDADRLVRSKEEALNRQIALAAANQANNVAGAQAELALAKKTQEEALKQRKKVQKQELALDTLAQSSNIITAITAALKLGPILGPIAVGAILATFAASKIKALALINKKTFRKGGYREIGGGTHESGNDTHVGGNNWAEKDESVGIFTAKATRKYKPTLKAFVNAANKGTLDKILFQDRRAIQGITNNYGPRVDTSVMEKRLGRLVSLTEKKSYVDGSGNLVINDRGRTTIVRNGSK